MTVTRPAAPDEAGQRIAGPLIAGALAARESAIAAGTRKIKALLHRPRKMVVVEARLDRVTSPTCHHFSGSRTFTIYLILLTRKATWPLSFGRIPTNGGRFSVKEISLRYFLSWWRDGGNTRQSSLRRRSPPATEAGAIGARCGTLSAGVSSASSSLMPD